MKKSLLLLIFIVFVFLSYLAGEAMAKGSGGDYKVKPKECMWGIGEKLGLDWKDLAEKNNIQPPRYKLIAGSLLRTEGVKKLKKKKAMASKKENRSKKAFAKGNGNKMKAVLRKAYISKKSASLALAKNRNADAKKGLLLEDFANNSREDKVFQGVLKEFADSEAEESLLQSKIEDGDMSWGYFRNHDICDVAIDRLGGIHEGKINWEKGRDPEALEAAGVVKSPSGKQIWIFLKGGTICFKHVKSVKASLSRVEERRPDEMLRASYQPRKDLLPERRITLPKEERLDDSPKEISSGGNSDRFVLPPLDTNLAPNPRLTEREKLPSIEDKFSLKSNKKPSMETALLGLAKEGVYEESQRKFRDALSKADRLPPSGESMEVLAEREIKKMTLSSSSGLKKKKKKEEFSYEPPEKDKTNI